MGARPLAGQDIKETPENWPPGFLVGGLLNVLNRVLDSHVVQHFDQVPAAHLGTVRASSSTQSLGHPRRGGVPAFRVELVELVERLPARDAGVILFLGHIRSFLDLSPALQRRGFLLCANVFGASWMPRSRASRATPARRSATPSQLCRDLLGLGLHPHGNLID